MPDSIIPTNGFDRATGLHSLSGTPTPEGVILYKPGKTFLEELPTSPIMELGEQFTITHKFNCDLTTGQLFLNANPRGTILTDSLGLTSRILSCSLEYQKGDFWILTMTAEATYVVPPDEFNVESIEFNPSIYRHPRYASVLNYKSTDTSGNPVTGQQIINLIQGATNFAQVGAQTDSSSAINAQLITDSSVLAAALELLGKVQQGFDTFFLYGFRVTWSTYFYLPQEMSPGGFIEDPVVDANLPAYFWSSDQSGDEDTNIFTELAAQLSPVLYGDGLSWLNLADTQTYERTWFKLTSTWIGGPSGQWDSQIYDPNAPSPALP